LLVVSTITLLVDQLLVEVVTRHLVGNVRVDRPARARSKAQLVAAPKMDRDAVPILLAGNEADVGSSGRSR
jgi:hypothetical protein